MARSSYEQGPYLMEYNASTGASYPSSVLSFQRVTGNSTQKRAVPANKLLAQTVFGAWDRWIQNGLVTLSNGNRTPLANYEAVSNSTSDVMAEMADSDNKAVNQLRQSIKDMSWNAAQSVAELGKTLQFVRDSALHMVQAYRAARKGDVFALSELFQRWDYQGKRRPPPYKRVSNVWLQWRYAVRPAMMDLQDAMTELYRSRPRASVKLAQGHGTSYVDKIVDSRVIQFYPALRRRGGRVMTAYTFVYEQPLPSWTHLGLTNLPALLWELTPWSFVVDNFIPIGTYLSGLDAIPQDVKILTGWKTVKHDWNEVATWRNGISYARVNTYERVPCTSIPNQPLPSWQTPKGDLPSKVVDALALLSQVVKRGPR